MRPEVEKDTIPSKKSHKGTEYGGSPVKLRSQGEASLLLRQCTPPSTHTLPHHHSH